MKHTECKDCELSNGDCGYHFKMDGTTNFDIPSLSACDKYGNCMFFKSIVKPDALISREALKKAIKDSDIIHCVTNLWYSDILKEIDNAPPVSIKSCRECPFVADEEKQITNGDAWKSYCEGQDVGFKKAEDVFKRMKLVQETVDCIRNTFNKDTESDKLVRNCMSLVQNAIDGDYHDMEEVDVSEIERPHKKEGEEE